MARSKPFNIFLVLKINRLGWILSGVSPKNDILINFIIYNPLFSFIFAAPRAAVLAIRVPGGNQIASKKASRTIGG